MHRFFKIVTNKYFLTAFGFLLIIFFFDQNNWFVQRKREQKLEDLQQNIDFIKKQSDSMSTQLKALNHNSFYLEKYAREHYHEKRDSEDVYLIIHDSSNAEKQ